VSSATTWENLIRKVFSSAKLAVVKQFSRAQRPERVLFMISL